MRVTWFASLSLAFFLSACNEGLPANMNGPTDDGGATGTDDAADNAPLPPDLGDNGAPSDTYPALTIDAPQVQSNGGPVLYAAKIVPVFFAGDDPQIVMQATDFTSKIGATSYWKATTQEYKVGPATGLPAVQLAEMAPQTIDDSAIKTWLAGKLNANDMAWPAADRNTLYVLHYPASTTITLSGGRGTQTSCQDFGGYHDETKLDSNHHNQKVAYAVIPRCDNFGGLSGIDAVTATESHELIEAATDPYPMTAPAYGQVDEDHFYWLFVLGGGEVGDMCAQDPASFGMYSDLPYVVQRTWSNVSAAAGHDPCVPAPANRPYFNAVPELTDPISLANGQLTVMGVQIAVGTSKTIDVDLFSDADTGGPFTVSARDISALTGGSPSLTFSLDRPSGRNGEKLHLTINAKAAGRRGGSPFFLVSKLSGQQHYWFGYVGN